MSGKRGFTLIELLIVVAIIGILAAVAVPNFLSAQLKATIGRVDSDFHAIRTAFEMYRLDQNNYPDWSLGWARSWAKLSTPIAYLSIAPNDPFQPKLQGQWVNGHNWYEFSVCKERMAMTAVLNAKGTFDNFVIASLGPDKEDDTINIGDYPNSGKFLPFQMSNGLRSDGDLLYETSPRLNPIR